MAKLTAADRVWGIALALSATAMVVVATSCGGASDDTVETAVPAQPSTSELVPSSVETSSPIVDTAAPPPDSSEIPIESVLTAAFVVTDRLGGEPGFVAVVTAFDRGYTLRQLLDAPDHLDIDGWITSPGGRTNPDGPPLGLLGPAPAGVAESSGQEPSGSVEPAGFRAGLVQSSDDEEYVAFVDEYLARIYYQVEARAKWGLSGDQIDEVVDAMVDRRSEVRLDREFDALFEPKADSDGPVDDDSAVPVALTLALVAQGYPAQEAIAAALLGTWEARGPCVVIPGVAPTAAPRLLGCAAALDASAEGSVPDPDAADQIELVGEFDFQLGSLEQIVSNELHLTVMTDGRVAGSGTVVTRSTGLVEATECFYDYEWQGDFTIEGVLTDTVSDGGGTIVELDLTSQQRHNYNRSDEECPVQIVEPTGATTGTGELILSDPAAMTATIEPARPSPFVHIPGFEASEIERDPSAD